MALDSTLAPFAAFRGRIPGQVVEREIFRIAATLSGETSERALTESRDEVLRWAQKRSGAKLPASAWHGAGFELFAAGRTTLAVHVDAAPAILWSLKCDDPDKAIPGRIWTTEVVLGWDGLGSPRLSLRQLIGSSENNPDVSPHTPGLLQQICSRSALSVSGIPISSSPSIARNESDIDDLIQILEDRGRRLPVIVSTGDERSSTPEDPLIDVALLARATLGLAHVWVVPSHLTYALSDEFGRLRSVFHGAVRIYMPGFNSSSRPDDHRLFLGGELRKDKDDVLDEIRRIVALESLKRTQVGYDILTFAMVRNSSLRLEQQRHVESGASEREQLQDANRRIEGLELELLAARAEAAQNFDLAASEEDRAKLAEAQCNSARLRIQALENALKARSADTAELVGLPAAWDDFVDWVDQTFVGRLVLAPAARRGLRNPEFSDPALAARAIQWLATVCLERRQNGGGSLANIPIEQGVENAPCGSDAYGFDFHGRRLIADWHVKSGGNTRDPARCLRIYYAFDEYSRQIIVADMPAHRRTAAS